MNPALSRDHALDLALCAKLLSLASVQRVHRALLALHGPLFVVECLEPEVEEVYRRWSLELPIAATPPTPASTRKPVKSVTPFEQSAAVLGIPIGFDRENNNATDPSILHPDWMQGVTTEHESQMISLAERRDAYTIKIVVAPPTWRDTITLFNRWTRTVKGTTTFTFPDRMWHEVSFKALEFNAEGPAFEDAVR